MDGCVHIGTLCCLQECLQACLTKLLVVAASFEHAVGDHDQKVAGAELHCGVGDAHLVEHAPRVMRNTS